MKKPEEREERVTKKKEEEQGNVKKKSAKGAENAREEDVEMEDKDGEKTKERRSSREPTMSPMALKVWP